MESILIVASAMPYRPYSGPITAYALKIPATITMTGSAVDSIPTESPVMMFVPCPVVEASAIDLTGAYFVDV